MGGKGGGATLAGGGGPVHSGGQQVGAGERDQGKGDRVRCLHPKPLTAVQSVVTQNLGRALAARAARSSRPHCVAQHKGQSFTPGPVQWKHCAVLIMEFTSEHLLSQTTKEIENKNAKH